MMNFMVIQITAVLINLYKIPNSQDKIQKSLNKILNIKNKNQRYQTNQI